jgi:galactokinase
MQSHDVQALAERFAQTFGRGEPAPNSGDRPRAVHFIRSPGRVNLIGEHTDYNDGFVLPMAIEPEVRAAIRARSDGVIRLTSTAFPGQIVEFSVQKPIARGNPTWANYGRGVAAELLAAGIPLVGMDMLMDNTLPVGSGLTSSAAILVCTGVALLTLAGLEMDAGRLALLCQKAEHEYAGVPSGIMDQTIVAAGRAGQAMLLDCRDLSKQFIPIDSAELRVVVANSMVHHELSGGEYAKRRAECEEGVAYFRKSDPSITALRDVTMQQVEAAAGALGDTVFRRCRHVVGENTRTVAAAQNLTQHEYEAVGQLMLKSHASLRDDYEVSVPELDFLVESAMKVKGVYGARMTGGGFGGCIVALTQPRAVEPLTEHLTRTYEDGYQKTPTIFATTATAEAGIIR